MTSYTIALFLHVVGAMTLSAALVSEATGLWRLRSATTLGEARAALGALGILPRLYGPALLTLLLSGLYMTVTQVGWAAGWPGVGLASMVLLAAVGAALTGRRMAAIGRAVGAGAERASSELGPARRDPVLWISLQIRLALVLGIVFIMTVKPAVGGALATMAIALVLGLASTVPLWGRARATTTAA